MRVPVTFGFEAQATSWLTWRASISAKSFWCSRSTNGDKTSARTTTLGVGASLNWGDLELMVLYLMLTAAGNLGTNAFMSNVSAVYNF